MLFERCGVENIGHEATARVVCGGGLWAKMVARDTRGHPAWEQADHGLTDIREEEYKALIVPWGDPSFWFLNALLHGCWGQRPGETMSLSRLASNVRNTRFSVA